MASIDAASRINEIIERVENLATAQIDNAGGYANQAIRATDGIHFDEGTGSDIPIPNTRLADLPSVPTTPPSTIREIEVDLGRTLADFFSTYYPTMQSEHIDAVRNLSAVADRTLDALKSLATRLGRDDEAVRYLKMRYDMGATDSHISSSLQAGQSALQYLGGRFNSGSQATTYLLSRLATGDATIATLMGMLAGGTAIPADVEAQLWQRDRSRLLMDAQRATEDTVDSWASRGFPLPPGAAVNARLTIQRDVQGKIAESSRERAIKNADIIIENIRIGLQQGIADAAAAGRTFVEDASGAGRFTVENATGVARMKLEDAQVAARIMIEDARLSVLAMMDTCQKASLAVVQLQGEAIKSAADYIRAVALGPQLQIEIEKARLQAESTYADINARYFTAALQAVDSYNRTAVAIVGIGADVSKASAENRTRLHVAKGTVDVEIAQSKSRAASAAATAAGNSAASALSTLNAIASLSQNS